MNVTVPTLIDNDNAIFSSNGVDNLDTTDTVLDPVLKSKVAVASIVSHQTTITALNRFQFDKSTLKWIGGTAHSKGTGTMQITLSSGDLVNGVLKFEAVMQPNHIEVQMLLTFTFPNGTKLVLAVFGIDTKTELFVNGESYTVEKFRSDFGEELDFGNWH